MSSLTNLNLNEHSRSLHPVRRIVDQGSHLVRKAFEDPGPIFDSAALARGTGSSKPGLTESRGTASPSQVQQLHCTKHP